MEPEKFENKIKNVLGEREIKPSAAAWEKLEQRLENRKRKPPYLLWISSAAAIAAIFFMLGSYFSTPVPSEEPQIVEQEPNNPVLEEKTLEPEVIQVVTSEVTEETEAKEKSSAEKPSKNAIFETPLKASSSEETLLASENISEATEEKQLQDRALLAEHKPEPTDRRTPAMRNSDTEVEALLLLATAELKPDSQFTVDSGDLLHQVEYELDQSFRQKVFEVVKEGFSKAKTAVANRDF